MVPIWMLSNALQCFTSPEKSINNLGRISWLMMYQNRSWVRYLSTTYASNGLENRLSIISASISNFLGKDCNIRIYNAFILLDFMYRPIVWHFCFGLSVYKKERNPKQDIRSSFKWVSDIVSRFTECSLSPNSMCPIWKPLLLKCLNAWITSITQATQKGRASSAVCP